MSEKKSASPPGMRIRSRYDRGLFFGWFFIETYKAVVQIVWPIKGRRLTAAQVRAYIKRNFELDYENADSVSHCAGACIEILGPKGATLILLTQSWEGDADQLAVLAHECFHATDDILSKKGVHMVNNTNNEPHAYLLESIFRRCLEMLGTK